MKRLFIPATIPGGPTATASPSQTYTSTPTITNTSTPTATHTPGGPTATFTPSPTATATPSQASDLIFADGFESGNLSAWTSSSTDGGDLSVSTAAALHGSNGLQAVIDDVNAIYITDDTPNAEPRYRARFYFDPNSLTMANNDAHFNFKGFQGTSTEVVRVEFRFSSGAYQVRAALLDDGSTWVNTNWFTITDASHYIEVDWKAATGAGANNGGLTLWIDGTQQADLTGADNDTWRVDRARIGALSSLDAGTSGTYYFDAFESRRSNYIGPMALAPFHFALPKSIGTIVSGAAGRVGGALPPYRDHFASYNFSLPQQQGGTLTFTPADDAYIANGSPTSNYGSATTLQVDNSPIKHFLLKFDVTGVNGQTISNAKIRLYNVDAASAGGKFYHVVDNSWQEETVTWNNAPAAETTLLAQLGAVSPNTWYEVDVTSLITADGTYSFRISDSVGGADYSSKEGANDPELVLTLGGTPVATNTPTSTSTPGPSPTPTATQTFTPTVAPTATATTPPPATFHSATFVYDGDGKRVKSIFNSTTTTYFVGNYYEVTGSTITKYYYAGSQRIAMRTNGTLNYLLGDHLGSTSLTTNANGQVISELRYKAWGEVRYASGSTPTQYTFTGQFSHVNDFGLMFYNARWLDVSLGRFAQADVLTPAGVQGLDRYAYVQNNPLLYVDPSGHCGISTDKNGNDYVKREDLDCTANDISTWSMEYRLRWFRALTFTAGASKWFHNIEGILEVFDKYSLGESASGEGADDWFSWTDAGLLESIQNGYAGNSEGAAGKWHTFFQAIADNKDESILKQLWGQAESAATTYGIEVARQHGHLAPDLLSDPGAKISLEIGNGYRTVTGLPYGGEIAGGGFGALTVGGLGLRICGVWCGVGGMVVGGVGGGYLGGRATYPGSDIWGHHVVYYIASGLLWGSK